MVDNVFKVIVQQDNSFTIGLGKYEKLQLMEELKKCYATQCKMGKWLDDNTVPGEQRDKYTPMYLELLHTISYIWDVLKRAGTTDQEIREYLDIPF